MEALHFVEIKFGSDQGETSKREMANNTGYLNSVQAQRAIAVLTDTLEKLQFLGR